MDLQNIGLYLMDNMNALPLKNRRSSNQDAVSRNYPQTFDTHLTTDPRLSSRQQALYVKGWHRVAQFVKQSFHSQTVNKQASTMSPDEDLEDTSFCRSALLLHEIHHRTVSRWTTHETVHHSTCSRINNAECTNKKNVQLFDAVRYSNN